MSADKSMLDRLMATPHKELVDDVIFYHDGWITAGRECNELKLENAKLREQVMQLKDDWEGERDYADQMEAKEIQAVAENAKLRDDLDTQREVATHNMNRNAREYKRVRDENEKLRELASILCFCMQIHKQCDDCKLNGAKGEIAHDPLLACDGLHTMLRELRIEVPE